MANRISFFALMMTNTPDVLTTFQGLVLTILQILNILFSQQIYGVLITINPIVKWGNRGTGR